MKLLQEFVDKVMNETGSFTIVGDGTPAKYYYFLQGNVGKARYVYGSMTYHNEVFYSSTTLKPNLVAIVADDIIYIVDEYLLNSYKWAKSAIELPKNVKLFEDKVDCTNVYANEVIFQDFYASLPVNEVTDDLQLQRCKNTARTNLLSKLPADNLKPSAYPTFNADQVAQMLCGFITAEEEALKKFNQRKEEWISTKSRNVKIKTLMEDKTIVDDWEFRMAEGLRSIHAEVVNVEFDFNGMLFVGKVKLVQLWRVLLFRDNFSAYDFVSRNKGKATLQMFGIRTYGSEDVLKCSHITKITYHRKEIYVRNEVSA